MESDKKYRLTEDFKIKNKTIRKGNVVSFQEKDHRIRWENGEPILTFSVHFYAPHSYWDYMTWEEIKKIPVENSEKEISVREKLKLGRMKDKDGNLIPDPTFIYKKGTQYHLYYKHWRKNTKTIFEETTQTVIKPTGFYLETKSLRRNSIILCRDQICKEISLRKTYTFINSQWRLPSDEEHHKRIQEEIREFFPEKFEEIWKQIKIILVRKMLEVK